MARIASIDRVKLVASFFVVCIHTKTTAALDHFSAYSFSFIIDSIARFAVPFFFMVSAYFCDFSDAALFRRKLWRMAQVGIFWSLLFLLLRKLFGFSYPSFDFFPDSKENAVANNLYRLFQYGFERHLWFIPAYMISMGLLYYFVRCRCSPVFLFTAAILLYLMGLSGQGWAVLLYPEKVTNWVHLSYFTRNGLFLGVPSMALGYLLRTFSLREKVKRPMLFLGLPLLFLLQYAEAAFFLHKYQFVPDYTLTTIFVSATVLLSALQFSTFAKSNAAGNLANTVYLLHPVFMYLFLLGGWLHSGSVIRILLYTPILFMLSYLCGLFLLRFKCLRPILFS